MGQGQIRIEDAERAFQDWRRRRSAGAGGKEIPEELWEHAVEVARAHGLTTTARRLRLNQTRLKHRCESEAQSSSGFVEIAASDLPIIGESVVELEDGAGIRLRLVLRGASVSTVTAFSAGGPRLPVGRRVVPGSRLAGEWSPAPGWPTRCPRLPKADEVSRGRAQRLMAMP